MVALAVPQILTGLWGVLAPEGWFRSFPGFDPRLVSAHPPFNHHLAGDAAAGFLATGIALAVAGATAHRRSVHLALLTYLTFAIPHLIYHAGHPAPDLTSAEDVLNVVLQGTGVVAAVALVWGARHVRRVDATTTVPPARRRDGDRRQELSPQRR